MIKSIQFKNFKALRDTALELGRFTLLVGPNGSGKTTAMESLGTLVRGPNVNFSDICTAKFREDNSCEVRLAVQATGQPSASMVQRWHLTKDWSRKASPDGSPAFKQLWEDVICGARIFSFQAAKIALPVELRPNTTLASDGSGLAGVLDRLRDQHPERFEALNDELGRWIPEFDRVLFDTPVAGHRAIALRRRDAEYSIKASDLSQGTRFALAILTLAYLPGPPSVVGLEEPDHGLHPRLLRDVRDAIYRLCYPENFGEEREPVQVIATTHSPYMLDLFRDHPEEIVICQKTEDNVVFQRLSDREDLADILHDTHLGDAWYSGILGGVPTER